jgi:hypothetical protein
MVGQPDRVIDQSTEQGGVYLTQRNTESDARLLISPQGGRGQDPPDISSENQAGHDSQGETRISDPQHQTMC